MEITLKDFNRLWTTSMAWKEYGKDWKDQSNRFHPAPKMEYETAYWFDDYASAILARHYLITNSVEYEMYSDEWSGNWVIVANLTHKTL